MGFLGFGRKKTTAPERRTAAVPAANNFAAQARRLPLERARELVDRVDDQAPLCDLALHATDAEVRLYAVRRLLSREPSAKTLETLTIQDADGAVGLLAVEQLGDRQRLKTAAGKAKAESVRTAAAARLAVVEEEHAKPTDKQRRRERQRAWRACCAELEDLIQSAGDESKEQLEALVARFEQADDGLSRDEEDEAIAKRFDKDRDTLLRLLAAAEEEAEEAEAAAAASLEEPVSSESETDASATSAEAESADEAAVPESADPVEPAQPEAAAVELDEASQTRLAALEAEAHAVAEAGGDLRVAKDKLQVLHKEWQNLLVDLPRDDPRRQPFLDANAKLQQARAAEREARQEARSQRGKDAHALVADFVDLSESDAAGQSLADKRKDLDRRWKALRRDASASDRDRWDEAWQVIEGRLQAWYEERDWQRFNNLPAAQELVDKAKALADEEDLASLHGTVRDLQKAWKGLGQLPRDRSQAMWEEFRAACDAVYARLEPWFAERDAQRQEALVRKRALLDELAVQVEDEAPVGLAGSQASNDHQRKRFERVRAIQEEWKALGHVPREDAKAINDRFKSLCDSYFGQRRQERAVATAAEKEVAVVKEKLCEQAEQLAKDAEAINENLLPKSRQGELWKQWQGLRRSWRDAGRCGRDDHQRLSARLDEAGAKLEDALGDFLAAEREQEASNAAAKEAVLAEFDELLEEEKPHWFREQISDLRQRWREIGRVPRDQYKALEERYRAANDRFEAAAEAAAAEG